MQPEYPMAVFDEEAIIEEDIDVYIRLALLLDMGLTLAECRAWEKLRRKKAS